MIKVNGKLLDKDFKFSDGAVQIRLPKLVKIGFYDRIVVDCKLRSSDDIMKMLLVDNALYEKYRNKIITIFNIDYLPYARQDRVCFPREGDGSKVMSNLLKTMHTKNIRIVDLHSPQYQLPESVNEISMLDFLKKNPKFLRDVDYLVAPDAGASPKGLKIAQEFELPIVFGDKIRDTDTGNILEYKIQGDSWDISGKRLLVLDDICDGGYTFTLLADALKKYKPSKLGLFVTHGIFSKGTSALKDAGYDKIYTTDSFYEGSYEEIEVLKL